MSKSINKYHKCIQELGRTLPGWVKLGALAVGVGVGVGGWSPGGGVGKAWAGSWYIAVQKGSEDGEREIEVRDVENDTLDVVGCVSLRSGFDETVVYLLPKKQTVR